MHAYDKTGIRLNASKIKLKLSRQNYDNLVTKKAEIMLSIYYLTQKKLNKLLGGVKEYSHLLLVAQPEKDVNGDFYIEYKVYPARGDGGARDTIPYPKNSVVPPPTEEDITLNPSPPRNNFLDDL
jgi:hypothetical protein